ncbi:hypothetical protein Cni_G22049 [Canna indica]|uniref:Uncharacterized protein n=1 Tax=Canna indica TaxID=4628 RepID=A0AAQ3KS04_9LILI|nr:hypothetical protein Cni_G22049 [Canna indica]
MGFVSFLGRVLFVSVFLLSAYQEIIEFGVYGGSAGMLVALKYNTLMNHVISHFAVHLPEVEMKYLVGAAIVLKGLGSFLFIFSSSFGAYLLMPELIELLFKFLQNLALVGALLFFLGMKNSIPKRRDKKKAPKSKTN